jgi:hypothetical protein
MYLDYQICSLTNSKVVVFFVIATEVCYMRMSKGEEGYFKLKRRVNKIHHTSIDNTVLIINVLFHV